MVNAGAGDDVIVLGPNTLQGSTTDYRDVVELDTNFGNDSLVGFVHGTDKINVNAFLNGGLANGSSRLNSLQDNDAAFATVTTNPEDNGVYSQAQINQFLTDGTLSLNFATGQAASAKGILFLYNANQPHVYTVLQLTNNGTTASATVAGSLTLEEGNTFSFDDLSLSNVFDATTPTPPDDPKGKGGSTYPGEVKDGTVINALESNYNINVNAAAFGNEESLTINGFGSDDKLTFDFPVNASTVTVLASGRNIHLVIKDDGAGENFDIYLNDVVTGENNDPYTLTPENIAGFIKSGVAYLDDIFGEGTLAGA